MVLAQFFSRGVLGCFSLVSFSFSINALADSCHPSPNPKLTQYIIGYGSLMQTESKNQTYPNTGRITPIILSGFKRGWFARGTPIGFSTTFLGVVEDMKSQLNAVIFKVPSAAAVTHYDEREKVYCRIPVSSDAIEILNHKPKPQGQVWMYISQMGSSAVNASNHYPIVQSYVDIFLSGCLDIENQYHLKNFANNCIDSTSGWSKYWVNDRIYPRRPFVYQPKAEQIDELLERNLPHYFHSIKIE